MAIKVSYDELRRDIGRRLGIGRDPDEWTDIQIQDVADIIKAGTWKFYWPTIGESGAQHQWTFLCPSATIITTSGQSVYELPNDYVRVQSDFTYSSQDGNGRLTVVGDDQIRSLLSRQYLEGTPQYLAIRSRNDRDDEGYEIQVYPVPDSTLTLQYRYEKLPPELSEDDPEHLGPSVHSELLIAACRVAADEHLNPESTPEGGGISEQQFQKRLQASIAIDQQALVVPIG